MTEIVSDPSEVLSVYIEGEDYTPPNVADFGIDIAGGGTKLEWAADTTGEVDGYVLRFTPITTGAVWEAMAGLGETKGTFYPVPLRDGSYAIKAVGFGGVLSEAAAFTVVTGSASVNVNVVQTLGDAGTWAGAKSATVKDGNDLRLALGGNLYSLSDWFTPADWFTPGGQQTYAPYGTYDVPGTIDLGDVYTSRVTPYLYAVGSKMGMDVFANDDWFGTDNWFGFDASDWNARLQVQTSDAAASSNQWSEYRDLGTEDIRARSMRFRLVLESFSYGVTPRVSGLTITVDMPDIVQGDKNIAVPAGGLAVTFAKPFKELKGLSTAVQNLATGDYVYIDPALKGPSGFTVQVRNSAGAGVARSLDYTALGYGRKA